MKAFAAALLFILVTLLQYSCAVSLIGCNATEPLAGKALDLINKGRLNGYLFLLRVTDAHSDKAEFTAVYYLVLDVKESDCLVQSRKHWDDCEPAISRHPSYIVIGQCKVIATTCLSEFQDHRIKYFNCTTSSVFSALSNTKDSPVLLDFFEDTELYRKEAKKALEKYEGKNGTFASFRVDQVERVARVVSPHTSIKHLISFLFYMIYSLFCVLYQEHEHISHVQCHLGHHLHPGGHEHSPAGKPPFKHNRSRDYHHSHKPHKLGCPLALEDKNYSDQPPLQAEASPPLPSLRRHDLCFGTNETHSPPHNHSSSEHRHYGHCPHRHHPHGHHPHGHLLHDHNFYDHGPCDPPPYSQGPQDQHCWGHGSLPRHSEDRSLSKGPFKWKQTGHVYRLPPLKKGEVLPLPEANFPSFSLPNHNP
ncbi:LOW QUALITY PROTEIN: histidine-rich glycoprotein [Rhynchonycteris naso]